MTIVSRDQDASVAGPADAGLVERAARRDRQAFAQLYDRHVRTVYRYALSLLGSPVEAEDATQDVFLTAWTKAGKIHLVDESALPWLMVTARFTCANRARTRADERRKLADSELGDQHTPQPSPEVEVQRRQLRDAIHQAVSELSATDQRLYALCIEQDLTYEAAAAQLGASHAAVRNRLSRLRRTLRLRLSDQGR